jgi:SAM-dependent methyltransferase
VSDKPALINGTTVRADFNALEAVLHYTRAAHRIGLWESERLLIDRYFPDHSAPLLEAGCGAGRATIGLWELGYRRLAAFDFAEELVEQARSLAGQRGANGIHFFCADATRRKLLRQIESCPGDGGPFAGALFLFNGLMQIPRRRARRSAMRNLAALVSPGAPLLFTTHDRDDPGEAELWRAEAKRWATGTQDPRLNEFGDRYFEHEHGRTFMHLPTRREILADLAATGWAPEFDAMRDELAKESRQVLDFCDNCRFWVARRKSP